MIDYNAQIRDAIRQCDKSYVIWYTGSRDQADYIERYSRHLRDDSLSLPLPAAAIKGSGYSIPDKLRDYFFLDFPDVVVSTKLDLEGLPVLGIEILEQKPVGWNHTQRFARAAASAMLSVPFAYVMPRQRYMFDKYTGSNPESSHVIMIGDELYKENLRSEFQILYSLFKLSKIHRIPCLPFFWPIDDRYKYLSEGLIYNDENDLRWRQLPPGPVSRGGECYPEIEQLFAFIDLVIDYHNRGLEPQSLMGESVVRDALAKIDPDTTDLYTAQHVGLKDPDGGHLKIGYRTATAQFVEKVRDLPGLRGTYLDQLLLSKEFQFFTRRPETVVVSVDADPRKGGRGFADPYSGVVASFDYRYCRDQTMGRTVRKRDLNLVFMPVHRNAGPFFEGLLVSEIGRAACVGWAERRSVGDTLEITRRLFGGGPHGLKKESKNFFLFCDLVVTPTNLFVGSSFVV